MAVVLGAGDSFHLVPRAMALCTTGLENYTVALWALGKWITSVTMTVFYVLLYYVWRRTLPCARASDGLTAAVYRAGRGAHRAVPDARRTQWLRADAPLSWGIYRNIPFALLGAAASSCCFTAKRAAAPGTGPSAGCGWPSCSALAFYIPVVLWADVVPP